MQHNNGSKVAETATNPECSATPSSKEIPGTPCRTTCLEMSTSAPGTPHTDPRSDTTEPLTPDHRYLGPRALFVSPQKSPTPCNPTTVVNGKKLTPPDSTPASPPAKRNTIDDIISAVACMGAMDSSSSPCCSPSLADPIQAPEVAVKETPEARVMRRQLESLMNTAKADKLKQEHIVAGFMFYTFESRHDIEEYSRLTKPRADTPPPTPVVEKKKRIRKRASKPKKCSTTNNMPAKQIDLEHLKSENNHIEVKTEPNLYCEENSTDNLHCDIRNVKQDINSAFAFKEEDSSNLLTAKCSLQDRLSMARNHVANASGNGRPPSSAASTSATTPATTTTAAGDSTSPMHSSTGAVLPTPASVSCSPHAASAPSSDIIESSPASLKPTSRDSERTSSPPRNATPTTIVAPSTAAPPTQKPGSAAELPLPLAAHHMDPHHMDPMAAISHRNNLAGIASMREAYAKAMPQYAKDFSSLINRDMKQRMMYPPYVTSDLLQKDPTNPYIAGLLLPPGSAPVHLPGLPPRLHLGVPPMAAPPVGAGLPHVAPPPQATGPPPGQPVAPPPGQAPPPPQPASSTTYVQPGAELHQHHHQHTHQHVCNGDHSTSRQCPNNTTLTKSSKIPEFSESSNKFTKYHVPAFNNPPSGPSLLHGAFQPKPGSDSLLNAHNLLNAHPSNAHPSNAHPSNSQPSNGHPSTSRLHVDPPSNSGAVWKSKQPKISKWGDAHVKIAMMIQGNKKAKIPKKVTPISAAPLPPHISQLPFQMAQNNKFTAPFPPNINGSAFGGLFAQDTGAWNSKYMMAPPGGSLASPRSNMDINMKKERESRDARWHDRPQSRTMVHNNHTLPPTPSPTPLSRHPSASDLQPPLKKSRHEHPSPHSASSTSSKHSLTSSKYSTTSAGKHHSTTSARKHPSSHHQTPGPPPTSALSLAPPHSATPSLQLGPPPPHPSGHLLGDPSSSRESAAMEAHKRMLAVMETIHSGKPLTPQNLHHHLTSTPAPPPPHAPLHLSLPPGLPRPAGMSVPSSPSLIDKLKHTRPEDAPMFPTFLGLTPPTSAPTKSQAPPTKSSNASSLDKTVGMKHSNRPDLLPPQSPLTPVQHPSLPMPPMHPGLLNLTTPPTASHAPHVPPIPGMPSLPNMQHGFPGGWDTNQILALQQQQQQQQQQFMQHLTNADAMRHLQLLQSRNPEQLFREQQMNSHFEPTRTRTPSHNQRP